MATARPEVPRASPRAADAACEAGPSRGRIRSDDDETQVTRTQERPAAEAPPEIPDCTGLARLGGNSAGTVYRGRQVAHARDVAIRVLASDRGSAAPLRRAAEQAAALNHPNLVRTYEVKEHAGRTYVAMEHLGGGSLAQRLRATGTGLPWREAVRIASLAAAGLVHIHEKGLVHGAVRPSNVLLRTEGHVKLGDAFVSACALVPAEADAETAAFLAPETVAGAPPTTASDVWALGATLWAALAGRWPRVAAGSAEPPPIDGLRQDLPRDVGVLVTSMLAADPAARPSHAADVRRRLMAAISVPDTARETASARKKSAVNMKFLVAAGVAVVGLALWWWSSDRDDGAPDDVFAADAKAAAGPKLTEAARRLAALVAREEALGPVRASNLRELSEVADGYAAIGSEFSIDDPAVSAAWRRRRALAHTLASVAEDDPGAARRAERWIDETTAASKSVPRRAGAPARATSELEASRDAAFDAAEELIADGRFGEGLGAMAAWVVSERAAAADPTAAPIEEGARLLREAAVGVAMQLRADLDVDAAILAAHLPETSCFDAPGVPQDAPDFVRARFRLDAIRPILATDPARERVAERRAALQEESAAFQVVPSAAPRPSSERAEPESARSRVGRAIESSLDGLPAAQLRGALRLLAETVDAERAAAVFARAHLLDPAAAASVRAEFDALREFAALPAADAAAARSDALAEWVAAHAATDASFLLAAAERRAAPLRVRPVFAPETEERFLDGWGRAPAPR